jgi:hypothetical protein
MPFVVHVVQQPNGFPQVDIAAIHLRKVTHRSGDGVAMLSQALRLNPLVQDREGTAREVQISHGASYLRV